MIRSEGDGTEGHGPEGGGAGQRLLDAVGRAVRACGREAGREGARAGWVLLALHLSRLPERRPHHGRVAGALLDEVAGRGGGQVFGLGNGDLALLFRPADGGAGAAGLVARLFGTEAAAGLRSLWALPEEADAALRWVGEGMAEEPARARRAGAVVAAAGAGAAAGSGLGVRQVAVWLRPGPAAAMVPAFREVALSPVLPDAGTGRRLLDAVAGELAGGGPLLGGARGPFHLGLSAAAVLSDGFERLAGVPGAGGRVMGVGIPLADAVADPDGFARARTRVRAAGMRLVLDRVTAAVLPMVRAEVLGADLVKLGWTPGMAGAAGAAAVRRLGVGRVVLTGCDEGAAVVWGLGMGVELFQGPFVDTALAAARLRHCRVPAGCTVGGCRARAAAVDADARAGCGNPGLLDAGMPGGGMPGGGMVGAEMLAGAV